MLDERDPFAIVLTAAAIELNKVLRGGASQALDVCDVPFCEEHGLVLTSIADLSTHRTHRLPP